MEVRRLSQPRHCTPGVQSVLNQMSLEKVVSSKTVNGSDGEQSVPT